MSNTFEHKGARFTVRIEPDDHAGPPYVGVIVAYVAPDGTETDHTASLWGVEDRDPTYVEQVQYELADELLSDLPAWSAAQYAKAAESIYVG